jgi:hypothetical protein
MRRRLFILFCAAAFGLGATGLAQEGHPLTGTWTGDWGPSATQRNHVTIVMNWDGSKVTGTINPGPDSVPIASVFVDVTNWTVRIEADAKDGHISAEGRLEDIASPHRKLAGTWRQGTAKGDFRISRD